MKPQIPADITVRAANISDQPALATIWHQGWWDAHAVILPEDLARLRTLESFMERLLHAIEDVRVLEVSGSPLGFYIVKADELYQFYVAPAARGTGSAALLMEDAEAWMLGKGISRAWLACAIGNRRAARFYEKCGWALGGVGHVPTETSRGLYPLDVWRYEKVLSPSANFKI